jgi:CO/xanthine dehydrogenase FAD-binding subunit
MADMISPRVFIPKTMQELLALYKRYPSALLWSGGTAIEGLMQEHPRNREVKTIISIPSVEEMNRISRSERYLEIGAAVSYNKILQVGRHVLPKALAGALLSVRPQSLRNLATIGGNVAVKGMRLNIFPVLLLLDARVELRREGKSRWINVQRMLDRSGALNMGEGELIARFRIPFEDRELDIFRQIGSPFRNRRTAFLFSAQGKMMKGILSDFRCAIGTYSPFVIRNLEMEAFLTGKKLPLGRKEREDAALMMGKSIKESPGISSFQRERGIELFHDFLEKLRNLS